MNRERCEVATKLHIYVAVRRTKENNTPTICIRQVIHDDVRDLNAIRGQFENLPGVWRVYKTINARRVAPARKLLMLKLIDNPEIFDGRIDMLWKRCLMSRACRDGNLFLIDVDVDKTPTEIIDLIQTKKLVVAETIKTPNGWHLVCEPFDTRIIEGIEDVSYNRDGLKLIEVREIK